MKRKDPMGPAPSISKIQRVRSPESEEETGSGSYSDSEGSDVSSGSPRQPWPDYAKAEAQKIASQKPNTTIYCPVCRRHGRAGAIADMKGFIRHCETKLEHAKKHRGFLKFLTEAKGAPVGANAIVPAQTSQPKLMSNWENQGDVVTPFILIVHNFDKAKYVEVNGSRHNAPMPKAVQGPLWTEIVQSTKCEPERVDWFLDTEDQNCGCWRFPTCFAVFKDHPDVVIAHETLKARGLGQQGWESYLSCSKGGVVDLFGYKAMPRDMEYWDPGRRSIDWKVENHFNAVSRQEDILREANRSLKEETRKQQLLAEQAHAQRKRFESAGEELASLWENEKSLLEQEESRVSQSFTVLRCEKDGFNRKVKEKQEVLQAAIASKLIEIINFGQSDEEGALEGLMNAKAVYEDTNNALEEINKKHQESVSEAIRMKNEAEEARIQTAKFDHELKACEKKGREFEQAMRALDEKIQKSNAELNRIHNHPDMKNPTQPVTDDGSLAAFGIDIEAMKKQTCKKCSSKLGLPPSNEDNRNKKHGVELALEKSRVLLAPCGCTSFCKRCADKMKQCPNCKVEINEARPFTLFGYCTLN